jgi:hypothetical protein
MKALKYAVVQVLLATTLFLGACGAKSEQACSVPNVYEPVESALCSADADELRQAFATTDPEHFQSTAVALLAVWQGKENVGRSLPLARLQSTTAKLAYVPFLAQSIRNGRVEADLRSIQDFAEKTAKASTDGTLEQVQAISLVGIADADQAIPYLVDLIQKTANPSAAHIESIRALGNICDPKAAEELQHLQIQTPKEHPDIETIAKAIEERRKLDSSWCRAR